LYKTTRVLTLLSQRVYVGNLMSHTARPTVFFSLLLPAF